jgi:hypothetical protein
MSVIGTVSFLKAVKKLKTQLSAGKIMPSVFWDSEGVIHVNALWHVVTVITQYSVICVKQFGRRDLGNCQRRSCYCMTMLAHIWQF